MLIDTKFSLKDHVWVITPEYDDMCVTVFDSYVSSINIDSIDNGTKVTYYLSDIDGDYTDDDLVLYGTNITDIISQHMIKINKGVNNNG